MNKQPRNPLPEEEERAEILVISPEMAGDWLEKNTHNRTQSPYWVRSLSDRIKRGEWVYNGESIKFNRHGVLIDGQHRLSAVIESNTPIRSVVVWGAPDNAFETIDIGKRRTISDSLSLFGEHNTNVLGAALSWQWRYENNLMAYRMSMGKRPTTHQVMEVLAQHPGLRESVRKAEGIKSLITTALCAFLHYQFAQRDEDKAREFFESLLTGNNLENDNPVYRLRERIIKDKIGKASLPKEEIAALTIKAWNSFQAGKKMYQLRVLNDEAFPIIEPDIDKGRKATPEEIAAVAG